jgi:G:T-mismatch repair DNA endonuclease (very short patch repair protein)
MDDYDSSSDDEAEVLERWRRMTWPDNIADSPVSDHNLPDIDEIDDIAAAIHESPSSPAYISPGDLASFDFGDDSDSGADVDNTGINADVGAVADGTAEDVGANDEMVGSGRQQAAMSRSPSHVMVTRSKNTTHQRSDNQSEQEDEPIAGPSNAGQAGSVKRKADSNSAAEPSAKKRRADDANVAEPMARPRRFEEPEMVYTDENVSVSIRRAEHRQERLFRLEDQLYDINVEPREEGSRPPLLSLLDVILEAIEKVILKLQQQYDDTSRRQIYLTITDKDLVNGLNTGNYDLRTDAHVMANHLVFMLYNYLQSEKTLPLEKSFKIQAKILSINHARHKVVTSNWRPDIHYGSKDDKKINYSWLFSIPKGTEYNQNAFENRCLLASLVVGYAKCLFDERIDITSYISYQGLDSKFDKASQQNSSLLILSGIHALCNILPDVPFDGPHAVNNIVPQIADLMTAQVHMFSATTKDLIYSYPANYDESKRQIYLLEDMSTKDPHIDVISNIDKFFLLHGITCFYCKRKFKGTYYRHTCKVRKTCFACKRVQRKKATYVTDSNEKNFCDSDLAGTAIEYTCPKCNLQCKTNSCKSNHRPVCKRGWLCTECGKYSFASGSFRTHKRLQEAHRCGQHSTCRYCQGSKSPTHVCDLIIPNYPKKWNRLAFFQFEVVDESTANCYTCYSKKQHCKAHQLRRSNTSITHPYPNLCALLMEADCREQFSYHMLCDDNMKITNAPANMETYKYLPSSNSGLPFEKQADHVAFGKEGKAPDYKTIESNAARSLPVHHQLVNYIFLKKLKNTTFITHGGKNNTLKFINDALTSQGIIPTTIMKNQRVTLTEIKSLGIRFVDISNYVPASENELWDLVGMSASYFPDKLNSPCFYDCANLPPAEDFHSFQDSPDEIIRKTNFHAVRNETPWILVNELAAHCKLKVQAIARIATSYIQESNRLQDMIGPYKNYEATRLNYINPFDSPLCSKSSFIMRLYKLKSLAPGQILGIRNENVGIGTQCSRGEYEWISKVQQDNPHHSYQTAFSVYGQKYFKEAIPDIYCKEEKMAGFFNGCQWHGHLDPACPIMKGKKTNFHNMDCTTLDANFKKKISALKQNNPDDISSIIVVYECEWAKMKKDNPDLREFVKSLEKRPLKRLIPRDARK